jgi:hypothetical protein
MVDYVSRIPEEEGAQEAAEAPALLLVHGFGAFGEQWRGQLGPLASAGYQARFLSPWKPVKITADIALWRLPAGLVG